MLTVAADGPIVKVQTSNEEYREKKFLWRNRTFTKDGAKKVDVAGGRGCWQGINGAFKKSK